MANTYANGQNVEEGEWHFSGTIEANDDLFEALDLEPFGKKKCRKKSLRIILPPLIMSPMI